jgi:hypothetical protein
MALWYTKALDVLCCMSIFDEPTVHTHVDPGSSVCKSYCATPSWCFTVYVCFDVHGAASVLCPPVAGPALDGMAALIPSLTETTPSS